MSHRGAGPTGLMLANQLARRGVRMRIIDRHAGPARESRALGVQARTLEIYSHLGIADQAVALGRKPTAPAVGRGPPGRARSVRGHRADRQPVSIPAVLGQDDNERLLGDALRAAASAWSGTPSWWASRRTPIT